MKKYISIILAGILATACNLDQYPFSEVAADDAVRDETGVNNLVIGAYNGLHGVMYYEWAMTELRTDNVRMRASGSTASDTKLIEQLDQGTIITANAWVQDYWDATYAAINRANNVIAHLDVVEDEQKKAQFEGEARFLRAHLYFNLVRLWGPVFIVTKKTGADEARYMQRSPVEDVYALIEGDLNAIIDNGLLPEKMADADLGRADLKATKALLAKVYMTRYKFGDEKYALAKPLLEDVLKACGDPQDGASLVAYDKIFATDNEMNSEIIFAVRYRSGNVGLGSPFTTLFGPMNNGGSVVTGSPKHYDYPSDDLISAYNENAGDLRKDVVLRESYVDQNGTEVTDPKIARYSNKFIDPDMASEYDSEMDFPVIRLGDVILLYAEICNELEGPTDTALKYLNMTRTRAGLQALTLAETGNKLAFRTAVRKERRLEFAMENQRWFDLLRWGTATSTVNNFLATEVFFSEYDYDVNPISDWQVMLPIPLSVININDTIAQNPGY